MIAATLCAVATGQTTFHDPSRWEEPRPRAMVVRGPAQAPPRMHIAPAIVDDAVRQASYYGSVEEASADQPANESEQSYESSPSDTVPPAEETAGEKPQLPPVRSSTKPGIVAGDAAGGRPGEAEDASRRVLAGRSGAFTGSPRQRRSFADFGWEQVSSDSLTTVGASLAFVLGLFSLLMWVWRKAAPRSSRPLPEDVVSIVGRIPLAGRQVAQLIRIGGKLVLVCVTPEGAKPLTEITDPEEVARLLGIVEQHNPNSATEAFREVFADLTREPAPEGFLGAESTLVDRQRLADAYANTPGGRAYA